MKITKDGFIFSFPNATNVIDFDKITVNTPMKSVDIIAEFSNKYDVYIEIKNFPKANIINNHKSKKNGSRKNKFKHLKANLKYKYRDSYLFRHAQNRVRNPIHYICLLNFDNAQNSIMQGHLKRELPEGKDSLWKREIVNGCYVVNKQTWNKSFQSRGWTVE